MNMNFNYDDSVSIARERALLSEERWLIENLKKTRQQRNALKVEALYFQGLKAGLYTRHATSFGEAPEQPNKSYAPLEVEFEPIPEPVGSIEIYDDDVDNNTSLTKIRDLGEIEKFNLEMMNPSNEDDFDQQEETCNTLELHNLHVIPKNNQNKGMDVEYESEEEEEEWDQVNLEMGMLVGNEGQ